MTKESFINKSHLPGKLIKAVADQMGWTNFKESAQDITNYGIGGGFTGFIYYTDTVKFSLRNIDSILEQLEEDVTSTGLESVAHCIQGFRCVGTDFGIEEINKAIYTKDDDATTIMNAVAWYAGEEVARAYCALLDS